MSDKVNSSVASSRKAARGSGWRALAALIAAVGATGLAACGQKGPLFLPSAGHPKPQHTTPVPAAGAPIPAASSAGSR